MSDIPSLGRSPIAGAASPAGEAPSDLDEFEALRAEATRTPIEGPVDWEKVRRLGSELLATKGKDFQVAAYLGGALARLEGYTGAADALDMLEGLVEVYWETAFPPLKRLRGRANALAWFSEQAANALEPLEPSADLAPAVARGLESVERLEKLLYERIDDPEKIQIGGITRAMRDAKSRLDSLAPEPAPEPAAPATPGPVAAAPSAAPPTAPAAVPAAAPGPAAELGAIASKPDAIKALDACATFFRETSPTDALGFRLQRIAMWTEIEAAPPDQDGKTKAFGPAANIISTLRQQREAGDWASLIQSAEEAFWDRPLWLDAQRYSAEAAANLGAPYAKVHQAILDETRSLLARLPGLVNLRFGDDVEFADAETREWIQSEVNAAAGAAPVAAPAASSALIDDEALDAARKEAGQLAKKGMLAAALSLLGEALAADASPRGSFLARLELASLCVESGKERLALPLLEALDEEMVRHGLEQWEPDLATQLLRTLYRCQRRVADRRGAAPEAAQAAENVYHRLCRVDPVTAAGLD